MIRQARTQCRSFTELYTRYVPHTTGMRILNVTVEESGKTAIGRLSETFIPADQAESLAIS